MDNKLSGLLLKLRKGATSAFTTKDWIAILLSFGFQVDESGRGESKQVQLTAPNGARVAAPGAAGGRHGPALRAQGVSLSRFWAGDPCPPTGLNRHPG